MKKLLPFLVAVLIIITVRPSFAQETLDSTDTNSAVAAPTKVSPRPVGEKKEMMEKKEAARAEVKAKMEAAREDHEKKIENKRMEQKKKLDTIKDEKKRMAAERIGANLNTINTKVTTHLSGAIEKLENAIQRITDKSVEVAANGTDISSVKTALVEATAAISKAKAAIAAQMAKVYAISITTDAKLQDAAKAARESLRKDLEATKETVKVARDKTRAAAVALAQVRGTAPADGTPTPAPTPATDSTQ